MFAKPVSRRTLFEVVTRKFWDHIATKDGKPRTKEHLEKCFIEEFFPFLRTFEEKRIRFRHILPCLLQLNLIRVHSLGNSDSIVYSDFSSEGEPETEEKNNSERDFSLVMEEHTTGVISEEDVMGRNETEEDATEGNKKGEYAVKDNETEEDATGDDANEETAAKEGVTEETPAQEDGTEEEMERDSNESGTTREDVTQEDANEKDTLEEDVTEEDGNQGNTSEEDADEEDRLDDDAHEEDTSGEDASEEDILGEDGMEEDGMREDATVENERNATEDEDANEEELTNAVAVIETVTRNVPKEIFLQQTTSNRNLPAEDESNEVPIGENDQHQGVMPEERVSEEHVPDLDISQKEGVRERDMSQEHVRNEDALVTRTEDDVSVKKLSEGRAVARDIPKELLQLFKKNGLQKNGMEIVHEDSMSEEDVFKEDGLLVDEPGMDSPPENSLEGDLSEHDGLRENVSQEDVPEENTPKKDILEDLLDNDVPEEDVSEREIVKEHGESVSKRAVSQEDVSSNGVMDEMLGVPQDVPVHTTMSCTDLNMHGENMFVEEMTNVEKNFLNADTSEANLPEEKLPEHGKFVAAVDDLARVDTGEKAVRPICCQWMERKRNILRNRNNFSGKFGVEVHSRFDRPNGVVDCGVLHVGDTKTVTILIRNTNNFFVDVRCVMLSSAVKYIVQDRHGVSRGKSLPLPAMKKALVSMTFKTRNPRAFQMPVIFKFRHGDLEFDIVRFFVAKATDYSDNSLAPVSLYASPKRVNEEKEELKHWNMTLA